MSDKAKPVIFDEDNPEWTAEDFAKAKRGDQIPEHIRAAFGKGKRGRPVGTTKPDAKKSVTLRLDPDVLEAWRDSGAGWQARINDALRAAMPKQEARVLVSNWNTPLALSSARPDHWQSFLAVVHQDAGSAFGIAFPEWPGCFAAADDLEHVQPKALEAIELWLSDHHDRQVAEAVTIAGVMEQAKEDGGLVVWIDGREIRQGS